MKPIDPHRAVSTLRGLPINNSFKSKPHMYSISMYFLTIMICGLSYKNGYDLNAHGIVRLKALS